MIPVKTSAAVRAAAAKAAARTPAKSKPRPEKLPEWNLADLYPAPDAPEVKRDLERADQECKAFEQSYKGKLAELAGRGGSGLAEAVKALRRTRRPVSHICCAALC